MNLMHKVVRQTGAHFRPKVKLDYMRSFFAVILFIYILFIVKAKDMIPVGSSIRNRVLGSL